MNVGGILLLITSSSIILLMISQRWLKKLYSSYWFVFIFSVAFLLYFFIFRYSINIEEFLEIKDHLQIVKSDYPYEYSFRYSKILLLDMCPLISVLLPISLIIDKTRNTSKVLSLFGFLGGFITIFFSMSTVNEISVPLWKYIFIGEGVNYIMFYFHYLMLLLSLIVLMNSKRFTKWSVLGTLLFATLFICYVLGISSTKGIECNVTGLRKGDWVNPHIGKYWYSQYESLQNATGFIYQINIVFWYLIATVIIILEMFIKNKFTMDNTKKIWWKNLEKIDSWINEKCALFNNDYYFI